MELYNHYYRHGGRGGGGRDGVEVEDILIFIMILSYKANTPVSLTGERGYPNQHSPDHDASRWFWTGVMYDSLIFPSCGVSV